MYAENTTALLLDVFFFQKYDHLMAYCLTLQKQHCPWIHNCVGHFNHRYFVMFMTYLFIACLCYVSMGVGPFMLLADEEVRHSFFITAMVCS